eukprot:1637696-Pyramimonas_sp.AAC.1
MHAGVQTAVRQGGKILREQRAPLLLSRGHDHVEQVDADRPRPALKHLQHVEDDIQLQERLPAD